MTKESSNRLHPLVKFTSNGNIILQFIEEKFLASIIDLSSIEKLRPDEKVILNGENYVIDKILIEYTTTMHGKYGIPDNFTGEFDNFNTVINVLVE
jgi:hypothetical protein